MDELRRSRNRRRRQTALAFWVFVSPLLLGLLVFVYIPIVWAFILSLFQARFTIYPQHFVGLDNYRMMLQDPEFIRSLAVDFAYALFIVPTTFCASLSLALMVNSIKLGRGFFRTIFFMPTACSYVVASLVWRMSIFNGLPYGFANMVIGYFGLNAIA
ncbi:MAG: sugar ABC transporter permease [Chloroflexota bacterium]